MTIKKLSKFQTSDGQEWDDRNMAKSHENELHTMSELYRLLEEGLRSALKNGRPENILKHILAEEEMVRAILTGYHKRQPKAEIVDEAFAKAA